MSTRLSTLLLLTAALAPATLAGCAGDDKLDVDGAALDGIDVNEAKDDSLRRPTVKGTVQMGALVDGRVTRTRAFHAYDYTYAGDAGLVRLDVRSDVGADLFLAVYRRAGNRWQLTDWNDDRGDGSLNACMFQDARGGDRFRFVVTTYDAMVGAPAAADYAFGVTCKDGDCLGPAICGGFAGFACAEGQYCAYEPDALCGAADATGTCQPIPEVCTAEVAPVCGCNGQTYSNACQAAVAGTGIISEGECPPVACGGRAGATCGADEYCAFAPADICGRADAQGTCERRPQICTAQYDPVCGCDNRTYSNACAAAAAGVSVIADGECAP